MEAYRQYHSIGQYLREHQQHSPKKFQRAHHRPDLHDTAHADLQRFKTHEGEGLEECETNATLDTDSTASTLVSSEDLTELDLNEIGIQEEVLTKGNDSLVLIVAWCENDPANPKNWSRLKRVLCTINVALMGFSCLVASSIDSAVAPQAAATFGVSAVVESIPTAIFLIGSAVGAFFVGPFSETFGRLPVYIVSLVVFMIWTMAAALSPNIGAQIAFRFLSGIFGAAPLTCAGGTISDLWDPLDKVWALTIYSIPSFGGPMLGPVIGAFMYTNGIPSWRWTDWITLILVGAITAVTILFLPETHPAIIQSWKAKNLRQITGDKRYLARVEIAQLTLLHRLQKAMYRPFILAMEPIVVAITIYGTVLYCILFTFLDGYSTIFQQTYQISQGLTNTIFAAMYAGAILVIPVSALVHHYTKRELRRDTAAGVEFPAVRPETRLWWAMYAGSWSVPLSLFWLSWTTYPSISIWCPIIATVPFGFGFMAVFLSTYLYIIDAYEVNSASALTSYTIIRYLGSGGATIAGVPFYNNVGRHWTPCILAIISVLCVPIPFLLYRYGPLLRQRSVHCLRKD